MSVVDISVLSETAIKRQKDFKMLPYFILAEVLGLHGIALYPGIQNKHVLTEFQRKGGIAKPYTAGLTVSNGDVGKAKEMVLQLEKAYASVQDNINNYKTVAVGPGELLGSNKTKKHPWQVMMITEIVKTFGEDILDALFSAERDLAVQTPQGLFDGFDTLIDNFVTAGDFAAGKGNLITIGAIAKPINDTDTDAYDQLLEFWMAADPHLRKANTVMQLPYGIGDAYDLAYSNKYKSKPIKDEFNRTILDGSGGKCKLVKSNHMGNGQRIILTVPGLMHFGMDTQSDDQFVQVRTPYEDPNEIQFWLQADYGTRLASTHKKLIQINEGAAAAVSLSGDY